MQLGIFAKTFPGKSARAVLQQVRAAGFKAAQYYLACSGLPSMTDQVPEAIVADITTAAQVTGVELVALSATWNMAHPDKSIRQGGLAQLRAMASAAKALSIPLVTLCTGTRDRLDQWHHHPDNASPEAWADMRETMTAALDIAEASGLTLGIEPELGNVVSSAAKAKTLLAEMTSPHLKVVLDAANLFECETIAEQRRIVTRSVEILAGSIVMAHAKDRLADGSFTAAGQGVLDYTHYLAALRASGFDGPLITHGLEAKDAPAVAKFLLAEIEKVQ